MNKIKWSVDEEQNRVNARMKAKRERGNAEEEGDENKIRKREVA